MSVVKLSGAQAPSKIAMIGKHWVVHDIAITGCVSFLNHRGGAATSIPPEAPTTSYQMKVGCDSTSGHINQTKIFSVDLPIFLSSRDYRGFGKKNATLNSYPIRRRGSGLIAFNSGCSTRHVHSGSFHITNNLSVCSCSLVQRWCYRLVVVFHFTRKLRQFPRSHNSPFFFGALLYARAGQCTDLLLHE